MTVATDDFTGANGGLGGNYTPCIGAGLLRSGNAASGVSNEERASLRTAESFAADQYVEFTITVETNSFCGGLLRHSGADATRNGYAGDCGFNDLVYISRYVNGVGTNLVDGINVGAWAPGDRLRAEMVGWTINLYRNDVLVATAVDTLELYAAGAPGLYTYSDAVIDDAEFGDVVASQVARPDADITDGAWTPSTGTDLFATLDETPASDTDYNSTVSNSTFEIGIQPLATPVAGTQTFRIRAAGSPARKLIARLLEGGTPRATITIDPLTAAVAAYSATASGITDYAGLTFDFAASDATSPPAPGVTFGAIGTGANGGTTVAPSYPAGITAGQYLTCHVSSGATNSETPTTPAGWTLLATGASTDGAYGIDTGPRRMTVFGKVADGTESGTLTVSITNGGTCRGSIIRWTKSQASYAWAVVGQGANDSTSGTGFSAATAAISWAPGDCAVASVGQRVDSATQSAQALTAAGITFGARTNRATVAVTTGNDHRHVIDTFAAVTAGTATVATTWVYTASAAVSGGLVVVRLREVPPTEFARVTHAEFEIPAADAGGGVVDLAGAASAQATAAAALQLQIALAGAAAAQASAAGNLVTGQALAGAAAAAATASGALAKAVPLSGSAGAQATAAAALQLQVALAAAAAVQATATAALSLGKPLAGAAAGAAAAAGAIATGKPLAGAGTAQASAAAALQLQIALAGAAVALASANANLVIAQTLAADAVANVSASGALAQATPLAGAAAAQASAAAALQLLVALNAAAQAQATASGDLSTNAAQELSGSAAAQASATGALQLGVRLAGAALGVTTASGAIDKATQLAADAVGTATASGALALAKLLDGFATGQAGGSGALAVSVLLSGAASGVATASGVLQALGNSELSGQAQAQATASGALDLTVQLVGAALASATAGGELGQSAALNGAAVVVATAQGGLALSVALSGSALSDASAAGTLTLMVRLEGNAAAQAGASGLLAIDVPLSAAALAQASAAGGLVLTIALQGAATAQAQASGALSAGQPIELLGAATAQADATGQLDLAVPLSAAALAQATAAATLVLTIPLQGSAQAQALAVGDLVVSGALDLAGAASGVATATGALIVLWPIGTLTSQHAPRARSPLRRWRAYAGKRSFTTRMPARSWRAWQ